MANNRMYIKCKVCDKKRMIAKYYPSSAWYFHCLGRAHKVKITHERQFKELTEQMIENIDKEGPEAFNSWLTEHSHEKNGSFSGPTHFELTFESNN